MKSLLAWLWCGLILLGGCTWLNPLSFRSQSPEPPETETDEMPRLVGDLASPYGMSPWRIESVGLVTGLQGTGSDSGPTPQRAVLLDEMQARGVTNPNALLASKNTSLVLVQAVLRPGIQKGDRFDVEVRVPSRSETTSLRGGWLMECRLREMAVLAVQKGNSIQSDNRIHSGNVLGLAEGPVMVDPAADARGDKVMLCRGKVLGGGVCLKSRDLGLALKPGHQNVMNSQRVAEAVNRRFHSFEKGIQNGVATAHTDKYIQLKVHPRYKDNVARYVRVVTAVVLRETESERATRIAALQERLLAPETAAAAALELEAIGTQGVPSLLRALSSTDTEVRFYAAEALAYLDKREAAEPLGEIARREPAFRVYALTALSTMGDFVAFEQLRDLLSNPSAETRYGAFRALWAMNPSDPLVAGQRFNSQFTYHVLDVGGPAMIHVTNNRRPELVLFGRDQRLLTPLAVNAGNQILVNSAGPDEIAVSKFSTKDADQKRTVSTRVDNVVRAIIELGGTYPDVVQALQEAKASGALPSRLEVDALPEAGRAYDRMAEGEATDSSEPAGAAPESPAPELFAKRDGKFKSALEGDGSGAAQSDSDSKDKSRPGWLARILGRKSE